ncbi:cysteine peptidase family C39 domain-containing protein [Companilactobacillus sp. FL22-1]|uniref:cysteine peptidase family C39 domain-containing protein n=1 Tax=Companilactobacillus sp. FL22-1 TaxID=3373892 RepID=UPI0037551E54
MFSCSTTRKKDCGCAAICTLLKSQGFKVNTSKFNSLYYDGFVGINVKRMCEILKGFNINTTLFKVNSFSQKSNLSVLGFPCIALLKNNDGSNHYVQRWNGRIITFIFDKNLLKWNI